MLICIKSIANAQQLSISNPNAPDRVGERVLSFSCPLDGIAKKDLEVWVYYSTNKSDLASENCPRGRASCSKIAGDPSKMLCKFYFPHQDHDKPNIIHPEELGGAEPPTEDNMRDFIFQLQKNSSIKQAHTICFTDKSPKIINSPSLVYYKVVRERKATKRTSDIFEFTMPRVFVIGYMGDSYASGEGAPYSGSDKWDDDFCHRSEKSGGMRGINKLIERRRDLVVRVINTTCSGAKIGHIIHNRQVKGNSSRKPQLEQIEDWCKANNRDNIDIMLMGVGGNSMGFVPLAKAAIVGPIEKVATKQSVVFDFDKESGNTVNLLRELPGKYDTLNYFLENQNYSIGKVLMMNYPNMLHGQGNELCNNDFINSLLKDPINLFSCFPKPETNLLFNHINLFKSILTDLNEAIRNASERHGWELIRISAINSHGLCNCKEPYFNTTISSSITQGDLDGAIHPNSDGYMELYRDNVYSVLKEAVSEVQQKEYVERRKNAIQDAKAEAKRKMDLQIAKTVARKKLQERYKAELSTKAETQLDTLKFDLPKNTQPAKVNLKHNDDPRPKSNVDDKD